MSNCVTGVFCRDATLEHTFGNLKPGHSYKITIKVLSDQASSKETSRSLATSK